MVLVRKYATVDAAFAVVFISLRSGIEAKGGIKVRLSTRRNAFRILYTHCIVVDSISFGGIIIF